MNLLCSYALNLFKFCFLVSFTTISDYSSDTYLEEMSCDSNHFPKYNAAHTTHNFLIT